MTSPNRQRSASHAIPALAVDHNAIPAHHSSPQFWQKPARVWQFFVVQLGNGNAALGFWYYLQVMVWKFGLLVKLTFGVWDQPLLSTMEIAQRAYSFDTDEYDDDSKHESIIGAVGESHSLFWQFIPSLVIVAKAGEAFNSSLVFVAEEVTVPDHIVRAKISKSQRKLQKSKVKATIAAGAQSPSSNPIVNSGGVEMSALAITPKKGDSARSADLTVQLEAGVLEDTPPSLRQHTEEISLDTDKKKRYVMWLFYVLQYIILDVLCIEPSETAIGIWFVTTLPLIGMEMLIMAGKGHFPEVSWHGYVRFRVGTRIKPTLTNRIVASLLLVQWFPFMLITAMSCHIAYNRSLLYRPYP